MKKISIVSIAMLLSLQQLVAQEQFRINGKFSGRTLGKQAQLTYFDGKEKVKKIAAIKNGQFSFTGTIPYPRMAMLRFYPVHPTPVPTNKNTTADGIERFLNTDEIQLFLEAGTATIAGRDAVKTAIVKGGAAQSDFNLYQEWTKDIEQRNLERTRKMIAAMRMNDSVTLNALDAERPASFRASESIANKFIDQFPDSYMSWELSLDKMYDLINPEVALAALNRMSERLRNSEAGKEIATRIKNMLSTAVGQPAPVFSQADADGVAVSLASFKGKYVLLDFWASWCGGCREETPNVRKAYNRFHDKNLEVISISLDSKRKDWLGAIEKDGMPWVNLCDLQGSKNSTAVLYGISAVPQNFLIDPEGKIVARNLKGEELMSTLEKFIQ